ncbi:hypothetical protein LIER_24917 [Lithospermum erythrorhizon]|uniref:Transcription repressor n=1 Tax=Lithospermum erythrorhizon TaxID=34254 RepID=A0AAV3R758_LITER
MHSKKIKKHKNLQSAAPGGCTTLCCGCRHSVSSSNGGGGESSRSSDKYPRISSITHAIVQEKLDQMIREKKNNAHAERAPIGRRVETKFIVMVAKEKSTYDPREDFRESIEKMIKVNGINQSKDLRCLLNCYVSMNSEENRSVILEVFHEVCTTLFLSRKCYGYS